MAGQNPLFVRWQGKVQGPLSETQLKALVRAGKLPREAEISNNKAVWKKAGDIPGLFPSAVSKSANASQSLIAPETEAIPVPQLASDIATDVFRKPIKEPTPHQPLDLSIESDEAPDDFLGLSGEAPDDFLGIATPSAPRNQRGGWPPPQARRPIRREPLHWKRWVFSFLLLAGGATAALLYYRPWEPNFFKDQTAYLLGMTSPMDLLDAWAICERQELGKLKSIKNSDQYTSFNNSPEGKIFVRNGRIFDNHPILIALLEGSRGRFEIENLAKLGLDNSMFLAIRDKLMVGGALADQIKAEMERISKAPSNPVPVAKTAVSKSVDENQCGYTFMPPPKTLDEKNKEAKELFATAKRLADNNCLDEAIQSLEKLCSDYRDTETAETAKADIIIYKKKKSEAEAQQLLTTATAAENNGDLVQARTIYEKIVKEYPGTNSATQNAVAFLAALPKKEGQKLLADARQAEAKGDIAKALELYGKVSTDYPDLSIVASMQMRSLGSSADFKLYQDLVMNGAQKEAANGNYDQAIALLDEFAAKRRTSSNFGTNTDALKKQYQQQKLDKEKKDADQKKNETEKQKQTTAEDRIKKLQTDANGGDVAAMISLGKMYVKGDGVTKDSAEGLNWYQKASDKNSIEAQLFLGVAYAQGEIVPKYEYKAFGFFKKAANQDNSDGQYYVGRAFFYGTGQPKNTAEGLNWLRKSAKQGNEKAIKLLTDLKVAY